MSTAAPRPLGAGLRLSGELLRLGKLLLHQQCWLWGQDVKRPTGNLLLAYGFERMRPAENISGSSQYTLCLAPHLRVRLWGFGMYFGGESGIYLNRYEFVPRTAQFCDGWQDAEAMISAERSDAIQLVAQAASWIADYESWVAKETGTGREQTLRGWKQKTVATGETASAWHALAQEIYAFVPFRPWYVASPPAILPRPSGPLPIDAHSGSRAYLFSSSQQPLPALNLLRLRTPPHALEAGRPSKT